MTKQKQLEKVEWYLESHNLDYKRHKIIGWQCLRSGYVAIVQKSLPPEPTHYCLQYCGNGHYYNTLEEIADYARKRKWEDFSIEEALRNEEIYGHESENDSE